LRTICAGVLGLFGAVAAPAAEIDATWTGGTGNYNAATWSFAPAPGGGGTFPNNNATDQFNVIIDNAITNAVVTLNVNATVNGLRVDAADQFIMPNSRIFTIVLGPVLNNGVMSINATASLTDLRIGADVAFGGSGTLQLSDHGNNRIFGVSAAFKLTNTAGQRLPVRARLAST
jgi:hypothetical protein